MPKLRANLLATYRPTRQWMGSLGIRHSGRAYNDTYNLDVQPDVYGGVSSFTFVDLRGGYKLTPQVELALGVDNLADSRGFPGAPVPGRTVFPSCAPATEDGHEQTESRLAGRLALGPLGLVFALAARRSMPSMARQGEEARAALGIGAAFSPSGEL